MRLVLYAHIKRRRHALGHQHTYPYASISAYTLTLLTMLCSPLLKLPRLPEGTRGAPGPSEAATSRSRASGYGCAYVYR